jgi:D-alanine transaminase/branched-chain amino acid aminotransferase
MIDPICFIHDQFLPLSQANVPVSDLGLQRGYGVFDFFRVKGNSALFLDAHLDRFYHSAEYMHLPIPLERAQLKEKIQELINRNRFSDSGVRMTLTGGASPDGYQPGIPHFMMVQQAIVPPPDRISDAPYVLMRYEHQRQLPMVKSTDYLMAVWLQPSVREAGAQDVLYTSQGWIRECPRSNIFLVTASGTLVTPASHMLKGITRANILQAAQTIMPVEERDLHIDELATAREVFVSSTTKRIIPVTKIDQSFTATYNSESYCTRLFELLRSAEP